MVAGACRPACAHPEHATQDRRSRKRRASIRREHRGRVAAVDRSVHHCRDRHGVRRAGDPGERGDLRADRRDRTRGVVRQAVDADDPRGGPRGHGRCADAGDPPRPGSCHRASAVGPVAAAIMLVLGIAQVPALIVTLPAIAYIWMSGHYGTVEGIAYTIGLVLAGMADNVLKPLLLGRGVDAPMLVILLGALGGMATAGILGMFVGATLLAVGYQIFRLWVAARHEGGEAAPKPESLSAATKRCASQVPGKSVLRLNRIRPSWPPFGDPSSGPGSRGS